jgi:hypothetical protein
MMETGLTAPTFSPVRTVETVEADGRRVRSLLIYCGRRDRSVAPDACAQCEHLYGMSPECEAPHAGIVCSIPATPRPPEVSEHHAPLFLGPRAVARSVASGAALPTHSVFVRRGASDAVVDATLTRVQGVVVVDAAGLPVGTIAASDGVMNDRFAAVRESAPLSEAIALMAYRHVRLVPVVSHKGIAVGLFTELDALQWARTR